MIVGNCDIKGVGLSPGETNSPLIVDPNGILSQSIPAQSLQMISWNRPQIGE